jgi:hypothetical protein
MVIRIRWHLLEQISLDCTKTITTDPRLMRVFAILLVRYEYVGEMAEALKRQQDADAAMRANLVRVFTMAEENGTLIRVGHRRWLRAGASE